MPRDRQLSLFFAWLDSGESTAMPWNRAAYYDEQGGGQLHPTVYERREADRDWRLRDGLMILSGKVGYSSSVFQQDECPAHERVDRRPNEMGRKRAKP